MKSCLYVGEVRHRRFGPARHAFKYRLYMACLDLAELDRVFKGRWFWSTSRPALAWFRREDHFGDPARPLDEAARDLVEERLGFRPAGPVRLVTGLRCFGHNFNPVSFYFCHDAADERVVAFIAEVGNIPWRERHCYVQRIGAEETRGGTLEFSFEKSFHVSPFMGMDQTYRWRVTPTAERLTVHMDALRGGEPLFDATLSMERREITGASLARALLAHPFMSLKVVAAIHWEALRLWLKKVPVYTHPAKAAAAKEA